MLGDDEYDSDDYADTKMKIKLHLIGRETDLGSQTDEINAKLHLKEMQVSGSCLPFNYFFHSQQAK